MGEPKVKRVIATIDNVRIKEYDSHNVTVERYESVYVPKDKETVQKWVFKGYSNTILNAALLIQRKELLINQSEIANLQDYVSQVEQSNEKLIKAVQ